MLGALLAVAEPAHSEAGRDPLADEAVLRIRAAFKVEGIALFDEHQRHAKQVGTCSASVFAGLKWCVSATIDAKRGAVVYSRTTGYNLDDKGRVVYVISRRRDYPLKRSEFDAAIQAVSARFGAGAAVYALRKTAADGEAIDSLIAVWGDLRLVHLGEAEYETVEGGGSLHRGHLVDHGGSLVASARAREPVYKIEGKAGFILQLTVKAPDRAEIVLRAIYPAAFLPAPGKQATRTADPLAAEIVPAPPAQTEPRHAPSSERRPDVERALAAERMLREEAERTAAEERAARRELERRLVAIGRGEPDRKRPDEDARRGDLARREAERRAGAEDALRREAAARKGAEAARAAAQRAEALRVEAERKAAEDRRQTLALERKAAEARRQLEEAGRKAAERRGRDTAEATRRDEAAATRRTDSDPAAEDKGRVRDESAERKSAAERAARERAARPATWRRMAADAARRTGAVWSATETQDRIADERILRSQSVFAGSGGEAVEVTFECAVGRERRLRASARGFDRKSGTPVAFRGDGEGGFGVRARVRLDGLPYHSGLLFRERSDDTASIVEVPLAVDDLGKHAPRGSLWLRHYRVTIEFSLATARVTAEITPYADNLLRVLEACAE